MWYICDEWTHSSIINWRAQAIKVECYRDYWGQAGVGVERGPADSGDGGLKLYWFRDGALGSGGGGVGIGL